MIDSHCHLDRLDLQRHSGSLENALDAARKEGVRGFLCIGIGFDQAEELLRLEQAHSDVWLSMGVHPLNDDIQVDLEKLHYWCSQPQVVAVGETGLDYHYQAETRELQISSFEAHLQTAQQLNKPVVVHTRDAQQDTMDLIRAHSGEAAGVLHCFTESWDMAKAALDLGFYISISGIVSFRNADNVREVAKKIPADRLLMETDSPWLAPIPYRGKSNEPAYLPKVAECLAELRSVPLIELEQQTSENFFRLFSLADRAEHEPV